MKILNISLDEKVIEKDSAVQKRILEYGKLVDKYTVIVLSLEKKVLELNYKVKIFSLKKSNKILDLIRLKLSIWKILRKEKYSLISVQDPYFIGFMCLMMAKFFRIGLEVQVHGWEKYHGIRKLLAKYVLQKANAIRTVSQRLKKQLIQDFKIEGDRIIVVPVYVDIRMAETQNFASVQNKNKFIFLTVGRLVPVKNIEMQIKAIANLKEKFNNIELWIIGSGSEENNLKFKIENLKLEENVKLLGWRDNLNDFYSSADCFLLTSDSEGYGMVIVEAASYALPIIMTDVGCAGEFIKDKENGIVIPIKDQKALEDTMIELMKNKELRERLANNAKDSIKNLLTKEEILNLYKQSWEKTIKK